MTQFFSSSMIHTFEFYCESPYKNNYRLIIIFCDAKLVPHINAELDLTLIIIYQPQIFEHFKYLHVNLDVDNFVLSWTCLFHN